VDQNLSVKFDSSQSRADLDALSKSLDKTSTAADRFDKSVSKATTNVNASLTKAAQSMEKYAQVAALLSKIKTVGNPAGQIIELGKALDALGRARAMPATKVQSIRDLTRALNTLGSLRAPSVATIDRFERLLGVLSSAKEMPGAARIAAQLDTITASATRAAHALAAMPGGGRNLFSAGGGPRGGGGPGAGSITRIASETENAARRSKASFSIMGSGLDNLTGRFRLNYQAYTLFSTMFASFTMGQFVRSLYDANIQLLKLQKALLFATGTFSGAEEATSAFIGISQKLGLSIKDNIDTYGRFVISATASGLKIKQTNDIYEDLATALTVVGSSAQQQQLAFYGLTEMMQKGVVYSKEFNRQIGAQLPGNAIIGAQALSRLEGHFVSVSEFFKQMHSGTLLSAQFIPEWAKAVREMYGPLLALAQQRPDVAIQRLKNSFFIFAREVGGGKFMSSIGSEMKKLTDMIITGDGANAHLTKSFQHLADTLGQGLGTAIHGLGMGLEFIIKNFDTLFMVMKGFFAFKLAEYFVSISNNVTKAAGSMFKFSSAAQTAAASEAAVASEARAVATQTAVASVASPAANEAAALNVLSFGRRAPASTFQQARPNAPRAFGLNSVNDLPLFNWANQQEAAAARRRTFTSSGSSVSGVALRQQLFPAAAEAAGPSLIGRVGSGALAGVSTVLSNLGPIAITAATALALVSDKLAGIATNKGNQVTYGDVASGALKSVGDSVEGLLASLGNTFGMFGANSLTLGKTILGLAAVIKATFSLIFDLAHAIGTVLGVAIGGFIAEVISWGKIINDVIHGNITGAMKDYAAGKQQQHGLTGALVNGVNNDIGRIFTSDSIPAIYRQMLANTQGFADEHGGKHVDAASQKQIEAAVQQQAAAQANMRAATLMEDAMAQFNKDSQKLDYGDLRKQIVSLIDGTYARQTLPRGSVGGPLGPPPALRGVVDSGAPVSFAPSGAGSDNSNVMVGTGRALYMTAYGHLGENESSDKNTLEGLFKVGGIHIDPQKVAWCAAFVNAVLASNGVATTGKLNASSFQNYGEAVKSPHQGDIVVLKPQVAGDTGHVGFFSGFNGDGSVNVLGGNQNDSVSIKNFAANQVVGYRRPNQIGVAGSQAALMNAQGSLSDQSQDETAPGGIGAQPTESDADKIARMRLMEYKQIESFAAGASPAAGALAQDQERLSNIAKIIQAEQDNIKKFGGEYKTVFAGTLGDLDAAEVKYQRDLKDAVDPIGKVNRLASQANDITALRVKGLTDEADWQEKLNALIEEGYDRRKVDTAAAKAQFLAEKDRTDTLKAQIELQKTLNDAEAARSARTSNNAVANLVNAQILAHAQPGETLAQAREAQANQIPYYTRGAQAQFNENRSASIQGLGEELDVLGQGQGLNPTQRAYQDSYIKALQGMTGLSTSSLARLSTAASDADKKIAASYAQLKQELENPPGFQRWVDSLEPISKRMEDIKANFAEGLSSTLTDIAVGDAKPGAAFKQLFDDIRKQVVKAQMDNVLGSLFKGLGLAQSPEQTQAQAATTFSSASDTFQTSVSVFAQSVGALGGAAGVPTGALAGATSGIEPVNVTPQTILGSGLGSGTSDSGLESVNVTPNIFGQYSNGLTTPPVATNDNNQGFFGSIGSMLGLSGSGNQTGGIGNWLLGGLGIAGGLLDKLFSPAAKPTYHNPNGIIGTMSTNTVNAVHQDGQANILGSILNLFAQSAIGKSGQSGGFLNNLLSGTGGGAGSTSSSILSFLSGIFKEGGYSTQPVMSQMVSARTFRDAPHFSEGGITSGIPIIAHPNEAVIPLSRGRKIPVEMNDNMAPSFNVSSNITVIAPDPDAFRKSRNSIQRQQNRDMKRAATRNLITSTR